MRIVESVTYGKHGDPSRNEDGLFIGDAFVAVVDGVTSKCRLDLWRPSPGVVARRLLLEALSSADAGQPDLDMRGMLRLLDSSLRDRYDDVPDHPRGFFGTHPEERLAANAVVFSAARREIWLFGDCRAMVNGREIPTVKRVDVVLGDVRAMVGQLVGRADPDDRRRMLRELGLPADRETVEAVDDGRRDVGREAIMPLLRLQSRLANRRGEFGYFVFDGYADPDWPVPVVGVADGDGIVLASDGYPRLGRTLAESERMLADLRRTDPRMIHEVHATKGFMPGLRSFDDRTYVRFTV
ncbi:hypothetical protein [Bifidobacterium simiarum]|uniref:hypothetical protein n=1 Tax=Bifidobacterium simiarum TaxID=2045441 RepID=UPI001BDD1F6F|nr:hypothetical protein [Bifidobacterium simiarum]MBT1165194.1 hypothetical protein [Bifidobacterium simiarum]